MTSIVIPITSYGAVAKVTDEVTAIVTYANSQSYFGGNVLVVSGTEFADPSAGSTFLTTRGLMQFDTTVLAGFNIGKVELYRSWYLDPNSYDIGSGVSRNYEFIYSIGDFGSSLSFNQADYDNGTDCHTEAGLGSSFTTSSVIDLGAAAVTGINTLGLTTIKIRDTYNDTFPLDRPDSEGTAYYGAGAYGTPCYLIVSDPAYANPISLMAGA